MSFVPLVEISARGTRIIVHSAMQRTGLIRRRLPANEELREHRTAWISLLGPFRQGSISPVGYAGRLGASEAKQKVNWLRGRSGLYRLLEDYFCPLFVPIGLTFACQDEL